MNRLEILRMVFPDNGLLGWLGRQVAHVRKAWEDVSDVSGSKTIYRNSKIEEKAAAAGSQGEAAKNGD